MKENWIFFTFLHHCEGCQSTVFINILINSLSTMHQNNNRLKSSNPLPASPPCSSQIPEASLNCHTSVDTLENSPSDTAMAIYRKNGRLHNDTQKAQVAKQRRNRKKTERLRVQKQQQRQQKEEEMVNMPLEEKMEKDENERMMEGKHDTDP